MKRLPILLIATALTLPLVAQQVKVSDDDKKIVAMVNSETITAGQLDDLYNNMPTQMRDQYDKNGGKSAFLENYIGKRLLLQEAMKQGYENQHSVQVAMRAAAESALFEHYIRDVVSQSVVPDATVRQYYEQNLATFARPEQVKARHIIVTFGDSGPHAKTKEAAEAEIRKIAASLKAKLASPAGDRNLATLNDFEEAARLNSEDGTASRGGDLGWFGRGTMDPAFEKVAFETAPGTISEPFQSSFGYHIVLVEAKRPAGTIPFDEVKDALREQILPQHGAEIMALIGKTTTQLRMSGKVAMFPENMK